MSQADEIRSLLDGGLSYVQVRERLGCSRQAVANADAQRGARGRPRLRERPVRATLYLRPATLEWLLSEAARLDCTPGAVIDGLADRRRKRADF
jgi:hypothetical protein